MPSRMKMMVITIINSISVNPAAEHLRAPRVARNVSCEMSLWKRVCSSVHLVTTPDAKLIYQSEYRVPSLAVP